MTEPEKDQVTSSTPQDVGAEVAAPASAADAPAAAVVADAAVIAETNGETGLLGGVKAVQAKLSDTLAKGGLVVISPAGEAFDALECQAVGTVDDPSVPDETVAQVYQPGYKMGTKVIRPAMVTITTGGPKREKPEEE